MTENLYIWTWLQVWKAGETVAGRIGIPHDLPMLSTHDAERCNPRIPSEELLTINIRSRPNTLGH
jgi:hypothetical protein